MGSLVLNKGFFSCIAMKRLIFMIRINKYLLYIDRCFNVIHLIITSNLQLASLKPPFTGDSFPALKRNILSGRFPPIPRKYTDPLHKVVAQMLSLNPRSRPSAATMLTSPDFHAKLQLDEIVTSFGPKQNKKEADLIGTIKVPVGNNLRRLGGVLPKPCYPDVRPNSPSSWTVAEQERRKPPQVAPAAAAVDTSRSEIGVPVSNNKPYYAPETAPRHPLASIPEPSHVPSNHPTHSNHPTNYPNNPPPRVAYSNASNYPPKVGYHPPGRAPQVIRRHVVIQPPAPAVISQVRT